MDQLEKATERGWAVLAFIRHSFETTDPRSALSTFGYLFSLYLGYKLWKGLYNGGLAKFWGRGVEWRPAPNTWAVITGATDGIGLEYAKQFAEMGYSLLLLSRNRDKLIETKAKLLSAFEKCTEIKILDVDYTRNDIYDKIRDEVNKLEDIDILINNVGMGALKGYELFNKSHPDMQSFIPELINCNMLSMTRMIELVLPKMVDQRRGIIINISSLLGAFPVPLFSLYSASKAFMDYLSRALSLEYKDKGIVVQSVLPGLVATKLIKVDPNKPPVGMPTAKAYVSAAIKTVGIESRTSGHWLHKMNFFFNGLFAKFGIEYISYISYIFNKRQKLVFYAKNGYVDD